MTSRDSYRRPVSSEAALAELRRVAGTQLDPHGGRGLRAMILEAGRVAFRHTDEADFERELAFEQPRRRLRPPAPHRGLDGRPSQASPLGDQNEPHSRSSAD